MTQKCFYVSNSVGELSKKVLGGAYFLGTGSCWTPWFSNLNVEVQNLTKTSWLATLTTILKSGRPWIKTDPKE